MFKKQLLVLKKNWIYIILEIILSFAFSSESGFSIFEQVRRNSEKLSPRIRGNLVQRIRLVGNLMFM